MAFEAVQIKIPGLKAGGDLRTKQFYAVKLSAADTVVVCAGTTDRPIGILQNAPNTGGEAEVVCYGVTKVSADAALSVVNQIGTAADGQLAAYTPGTDTTKYICGIVLGATGAGDEYATALVDFANAARGA